MIDIKVPAVGESISEVTLVKWLKKDGDYVDRDEVIAELESEKATELETKNNFHRTRPDHDRRRHRPAGPRNEREEHPGVASEKLIR